MKLMRYLLVILAMSAGFVRPITNEVAGLLTLAGGVATGSLFYKLMDLGNRGIGRWDSTKKDNNWFSHKQEVKPVLVVGAVGALIALVKTYKYTPSGRHKRAMALAYEVGQSQLALSKLSQESEAAILSASGCLSGGDAIPYLSAARALERFNRELLENIASLAVAQGDEKRGTELSKDIKKLIAQLQSMLTVVVHNIGYIQLRDPKLFADLLKADAQMQQAQAQGQMASAQGVMAGAAVSREARGWLSLVNKLVEGGIKIASLPMALVKLLV